MTKSISALALNVEGYLLAMHLDVICPALPAQVICTAYLIFFRKRL